MIKDLYCPDKDTCGERLLTLEVISGDVDIFDIKADDKTYAFVGRDGCETIVRCPNCGAIIPLDTEQINQLLHYDG